MHCADPDRPSCQTDARFHLVGKRSYEEWHDQRVLDANFRDDYRVGSMLLKGLRHHFLLEMEAGIMRPVRIESLHPAGFARENSIEFADHNDISLADRFPERRVVFFQKHLRKKVWVTDSARASRKRREAIDGV